MVEASRRGKSQIQPRRWLPCLHPQGDVDSAAVDISASRLTAGHQLQELGQPEVDPMPGYDGCADIIESDGRVGL
jgi:hypothetical protein